jgi:hypothetical protein
MISAISPYSEFAIASPGDLHLSFFNTLAFRDLSIVERRPPGKPETRALAETIRLQSFNRLRSRTQTGVTVALYDLEKFPRLRNGRERKPTEFGPKDGVELLYRPPRFGIRRNARNETPEVSR